MRAVFKYPLRLEPGPQIVTMPFGHVIRYVGAQDGQLAIWAEVDSEVEKRDTVFWVVGLTIPGDAFYIGTAEIPPFVWHVFQQGR